MVEPVGEWVSESERSVIDFEGQLVRGWVNE